MASRLIPVKSDWQAAVLVCRKCSRKLDGGFGRQGGEGLAKVLRKALGLGKGRRGTVGIVGTDCLKLCPKRGVAVIDTARPGEWLVVQAGTPIEDVVAALPSLQALPPA